MSGERGILAQLVGGDAVEIDVEGASMLPWLRSGDRVRVVPVAASDVCRGDVVLALVGPRWVLHRVIATDARGARLRGDANATDDGPPERVRVIGRATAAWGPGGRTRHLPLGVAGRLWVRLAPWSARLVRRLGRTAATTGCS